MWLRTGEERPVEGREVALRIGRLLKRPDQSRISLPAHEWCLPPQRRSS